MAAFIAAANKETEGGGADGASGEAGEPFMEGANMAAAASSPAGPTAGKKGWASRRRAAGLLGGVVVI